jgi:hypothetical protein
MPRFSAFGCTRPEETPHASVAVCHTTQSVAETASPCPLTGFAVPHPLPIQSVEPHVLCRCRRTFVSVGATWDRTCGVRTDRTLSSTGEFEFAFDAGWMRSLPTQGLATTTVFMTHKPLRSSAKELGTPAGTQTEQQGAEHGQATHHPCPAPWARRGPGWTERGKHIASCVVDPCRLYPPLDAPDSLTPLPEAGCVLRQGVSTARCRVRAVPDRQAAIVETRAPGFAVCVQESGNGRSRLRVSEGWMVDEGLAPLPLAG